MDKICLNKNFSTTRLLTDELYLLENNSEDKFESSFFLLQNVTLKYEGGLRKKGYFKKSYDNDILISVITVVFNGEQSLEKTIKSVLNQNYSNIEYIIIDGGSTDGSLEIIKKFEDKIDYWISEPDKGIYDAFNKGIKLCAGEIIHLLNSDDIYYNDNVIKTVVKNFTENLLLASSTVSETIIGNKIIKKATQPKSLYIDVPFMHPSLFVKKDAYKIFGLFDTKYKIAGDVDFIFRLFSDGVKYKILDVPTILMNPGGLSDKYFLKGKKEYRIAYKKYFKRSFLVNIFTIYVLMAYFYRRIKNILFKK